MAPLLIPNWLAIVPIKPARTLPRPPSEATDESLSVVPSLQKGRELTRIRPTLPILTHPFKALITERQLLQPTPEFLIQAGQHPDRRTTLLMTVLKVVLSLFTLERQQLLEQQWQCLLLVSLKVATKVVPVVVPGPIEWPRPVS